MWLLLFIGIPAVELVLLIEVGGRIGALETILLIVLTGIVGWSLLKYQGLVTLHRIRSQMAQGIMPARELVAGLVLLGAGLLLLTPGFLTDTVGFLMLVPTLRRLVAGRLMKRFGKRVIRRDDPPGPFFFSG